MVQEKKAFLAGQGNVLLLAGGAGLIVIGTALYVTGVRNFLPIALLLTGGVCGLVGLYGVLTSQFGAGRATAPTAPPAGGRPRLWERLRRKGRSPAVEAAALAAARVARGDLSGAIDEARAHLATEERGGGGRALRFLVVDDEFADRRLVRTILIDSFEPVTVVQAENGAQAVNELAKGRFDVVISGINMPHINGMELLAHVKEQHPRAQVILVSALAHLKRSEALQAGAAECLVKPANKHILTTAIHKALRGEAGLAARRRA